VERGRGKREKQKFAEEKKNYIYKREKRRCSESQS